MKYLTLFFTSLLLVTGARLVWGGVLTGSPQTQPAAVQPAVRTVAEFTPFPEDVLPFNAAQWQERLGCSNDGLHYIGYTGQSSQHLAVIQSGQHEQLYALGDALSGDKRGRIIALDAQRVVTRDDSGLQVICRGDTLAAPAPAVAKAAAAPVARPQPTALTIPAPSAAHSAPAQPVTQASAPVAEKVYSSPVGKMSRVVSPQGTVTGYRLQECQRYCWLLKTLSLQTGDVITAIQGSPVAGLTLTQMKDQMMKQQQDIHLTVERNGQLQNVTLPWRYIAPLTRFMPGATPHE